MVCGGGIVGLSVYRGFGVLVLMAVLALAHEDVVVELKTGEFPFLRREVLWQGYGCWAFLR